MNPTKLKNSCGNPKDKTVNFEMSVIFGKNAMTAKINCGFVLRAFTTRYNADIEQRYE